MAQRRMFSLQIVDTDAFLDMPASSQLLYFHLAMRADDEGFISNHKKIMKTIGSQDDDLRVLLSKRFIIQFSSGIIIIKHWRIHNYIQSDRFHKTRYEDEKKQITLKENGAYTECIQNVSILDTEVRLGKVSIGKDIIPESSTIPVIKPKKKRKTKDLTDGQIQLRDILKDKISKEYKTIYQSELSWDAKENTALKNVILHNDFETIKTKLNILRSQCKSGNKFYTFIPSQLLHHWNKLVETSQYKKLEEA